MKDSAEYVKSPKKNDISFDYKVFIGYFNSFKRYWICIMTILANIIGKF